jgi:aldose sugar dehydrogenase
MKKYYQAIFAFSLFSFIFQSTHLQAAKISNPEKIYTQYCSSCHGEKVEAFVDRKWKHGNSKEELIKVITNGVVDAGMPSWKAVVSKKDISELADLISKSLKNVEQYKFTQAPKTNVYVSGKMTIKLDTVATGLDSPWGLTQLPNNDILITDRSGSLYKIGSNKEKVKIKNTPEVLAKGQGGLLDIEIHPEYSKNGWVYLSYSKYKVVEGVNYTTTAIVRGRIKEDTFVDSEEIFEAMPYTKTTHHYGSRIVFDGKGYMFFSVGERGLHFEYAQSTENDLGKIHRLHDDGKIPTDNPFYNTAPNRPSIYTYGNRNPQGLVYDKSNDWVWETEHGPRGGDEINVIKKGVNYGWPTISYGINYDGKPITNLSAKEGMEQPEYYYLPSIAPSGTALVTSDKYGDWKGSLLIGSLRFNYLERVVLKNNKFSSNQKELLNIGRMRNIKQGSDGYLYVGVENPGMVFRLVPSF